jgi:hypothetical protein
VTAPTQPPDPRVQRIADAAREWGDGYGTASHEAFARVLVEELGGREGDKPVAPSFPVEWRFVLSVLDDIMPGWANGYMASGAIRAIAEERNACRAQQRENAETIQALRERVETAEAANTELDNARKSAEQSARDLRENNATLRAELDAIKGAQVPYRWTVVSEDRLSFTFTSVESAQTWAKNEGGEVIPLYRHHAPALPVVGACVVKDGPFGLLTWLIGSDQHEKERAAAAYAKMQGGKAYRMYRDVTPLSTEGGK